MRKLMLAALVVAVTVSPAFGQRQQRQGPGRGGFGMGVGQLALLSLKPVQEELKLSADQVKDVTELNTKQREALQGVQREERAQKMQELAKTNQEALAKVLNPEQQKRLKQLSLQAGGVMALARDAEAAKAIGLTDEQKEKLQTMQREQGAALRDLVQGDDRKEAAKKLAAARKTNNEKAMDLLTAEQKTKWKELTGEPFKGDLNAGFGGGGAFGRGKRNKQ